MLENSTVSFCGVSVALGSSDATPAFDLTDATNYPASSLDGSINLVTQVSGVLSVASGGTGSSTLDNLITLGTHTTGNYVESVSAGTGISITNTAAEGSTHEISVNGSEITSLGTVTSGTWNASVIDKQYISLSTISVGDLSDISFNASTATDGDALLWNDTSKKWEVGQVSTNAPFDVSGNMNNHIIPTVNEAYDIGSAAYKIRDLFVSNNSIWVGEEHKIEVTNGQLKTRKLQKTSIPSGITSRIPNASLSDAVTTLVKSDGSTIADFKIADWINYARQKGYTLSANQIFLAADTSNDEGIVDSITNQDISLNYISASNLVLSGDISANDASFNVVNIDSLTAIGLHILNPSTSYFINETQSNLHNVGMQFRSPSASDWIIYRKGSSIENKLRFGYGSSDHLIITDSGSLGIGTDSPDERLHVSGNAIITGDISANDASFNVVDAENININGSSIGSVYETITNVANISQEIVDLSSYTSS